MTTTPIRSTRNHLQVLLEASAYDRDVSPQVMHMAESETLVLLETGRNTWTADLGMTHVEPFKIATPTWWSAIPQ